MQSISMFEVLKQVISSWQVIAVTVVIILYLNLVFFVSRKRHNFNKIHKISIKRKKSKTAEQTEGPEEIQTSGSVNDELGLEES